MSFANLKRNRGSIEKLVKAAEAAGGGSTKSYKDERVWKPTVDKAGNGYAVLRFLPAAEGEALPFVKYWDHGFKGPTGKWYIERSLTTIGLEDPVGEMNSRLWNMVDDDKSPTRKQARDQKRRLHYSSNIMVVSDPSNPENEGKVFLYEYGKKIHDKIMDSWQPSFADEKPVDPFDMWEGANFKLKIRQVEGYRNYDKSEFDSQSALSESEEALEKIYDSMHSLATYTDPTLFKSYDELKKKLESVLGVASEPTMQQQSQMHAEMPQAPARSMPAQSIEEMVSSGNDDEADAEDTMSYFATLAAGD